MRLLIATMNVKQADHVLAFLYMQSLSWDVSVVMDGEAVIDCLSQESYDLLLLHSCLPKIDGFGVLSELWTNPLVCPPRILYLSEPEMTNDLKYKPDCIVPITASSEQIAQLLEILAKKPLPMLAAATSPEVAQAVDLFLDALLIRSDLKGRKYAAWMLAQLVQSSVIEHQPIKLLYASCAKAHHTTAAAVERCLRIAVENVFTQGSMIGIEQFFGATIDPERGKPTNRAFLIQAMHQIRIGWQSHSRPSTLSPNNSEIHQSPAAPTTV